MRAKNTLKKKRGHHSKVFNGNQSSLKGGGAKGGVPIKKNGKTHLGGKRFRCPQEKGGKGVGAQLSAKQEKKKTEKERTLKLIGNQEKKS